MTEPLSPEVFEYLSGFLKGENQAVSFALDLLFLAHKIDDLVDGDVPVSVEDIKLIFRKLIVDFPYNNFYQRWRNQLEPMISNAYLSWLASTYLEKGNREDRFCAFYIRNDVLRVIQHMMLLIGGPAYVQEQGPLFWKTLGVKEAKYDEFKSEAPNA